MSLEDLTGWHSGAPTGLPASISGVAGTVAGVDPAVLTGINAHPAGWYADLHTADFPDGAVRGQLFRTGTGTGEGSPFAARVLSGAQIYACTQQPSGAFAYTQHNVLVNDRKSLVRISPNGEFIHPNQSAGRRLGRGNTATAASTCPPRAQTLFESAVFGDPVEVTDRDQRARGRQPFTTGA